MQAIRHDPVVPVADLDRLMTDAAGDLVIADVRWYLDGRDGQVAFRAGHLPGAVWVDLDGCLAAHGRPLTDGRHPLPDPDDFAASMGSLGIGDDTVVIAYDDTGGLSAGRLVVMLRMIGRTAALLDGGLAAWSAAGRPIETGEGAARPTARFTAAPWPAARLASADDAARHVIAGGVLLDARPTERFTGEVASIDPQRGHIPGARSAPWSAVLEPGSTFRSPAELRRYYESLGADGEVIAACGSGVSACMNVLAMERAGMAPPRLFVASWSGWASDPSRPVETGPGA